MARPCRSDTPEKRRHVQESGRRVGDRALWRGWNERRKAKLISASLVDIKVSGINKKLLGTSATLVVTGALLVVTRCY